MRARCLLLLAAFAPLLCGCDTLRYYSQAVGGHLDLMRRATPIDEQLVRDELPAAFVTMRLSTVR